MTTDGRPAWTMVGTRHAQEVVRFLNVVSRVPVYWAIPAYLLVPYVVHPAKIFPSHQKLLYLGKKNFRNESSN